MAPLKPSRSATTSPCFSPRFSRSSAEILYRLEREDANGRDVAALKTLMGVSGFSTIGRLSAFHEDVVQPLSVAEYLLRSPASLALLLEAAPFETLEQVDALLARRILARQTP